ncbi:MAG: TldD/PmbA family protein [candidate division WOR-3 bacterium]|nr:TldD/PmbA family protein [candidate division WOR-3 bacterium]
MIGKREARRIVNFVKDNSKADQVEVSILNHEQALTRFANNYIHQNVSESNSSISIRVVLGKKLGIASTNSLDLKKIRETVAWAERIAHHQRENKDFVSLPKAPSSKYRVLKSSVKSTGSFSERDRARAVGVIVGIARQNDLDAFGSVSNGSAEICVGNSLGIFAYSVCGDIFTNIVMSTGNSTGYAQIGARDVRDVDFKKLAEIAAKKALLSRDPVDLSPGSYTTIFEPLAASEFIDYMSFYAFNGKIFQEERSYLTGKLGSKIVDDRITVVDDPFARNGFTFPFDFEGVPKKRLVLIDKGVAENVVYDSLAAYKEKKKSTGHALGAPNPFGPIPLNIVMKPGGKSVDEMIRETDHGILVTRFHYTNIIDPHKLIFTGMTRDGTFLIENGKLTKGVKNLRFTENIIDVMNRVHSISNRPELVAGDPGYGPRFATGTVVPALKVRDFTFTSATDF